MKNKLLYIYILCTPVLTLAQERKPLYGRAASGSMPAEGQLVVNLSSQREIKADSLGNFVLMAKPGDTIVAAITKPRKVVLKETDFAQNPFLVEIPAYELEEVIIINTVKLIQYRFVFCLKVWLPILLPNVDIKQLPA
ncbi:hypothetical protein D3C87_249130 [compost metagenome]